MTNKSFLIGKKTTDLRYSDKDISLMSDALRKYQYDVYIPPQDKHLILSRFDDFLDEISQTDTIIFYFTGHAFMSNGDLIFVLGNDLNKNGNVVEFSYFLSRIKKCSAPNKLIILDCCNASNIHNSNWIPEDSASYRILTASERLESAKEVECISSSFLTYMINMALLQKSEEIVNKQGDITINNLYEWIKEYAKKFNSDVNMNLPIPNLFGNSKYNFPIIHVNNKNASVSDGSSETRKYHNLRHPYCEKFIGRRNEIKELAKRTSNSSQQNYVLVYGIGGVGKTDLVLEFANRCLSSENLDINFPSFDSIIFTSFKEEILLEDGVHPRKYRETSLLDVLAVIISVLDIPMLNELEEKDKIQKIYRYLARQRTLLIIDNLETLEDEESDKIFSFVQGVPLSTKVISTTRKLTTPLASIHLNSLNKEESIKLIESQFQYKKSLFSLEDFDNEFKIDYSDELAAKIYEKFGGVPIALVCAVGQLAMGYELETILGEKAGIKLDKNLPEEIAQFCFKSSVDQLEKPSYQILLALSIFPDFASRRAILSVAGVGDHDKYFVELTRRSLVVRNDLNRYSLISIVSNYMNSELCLQKNENFTKAARRNWINWYKAYVKKHGGLDWQDWRIHYDKIDLEWQNILSLLNWCRYDNLKEKYESIRTIWIDLDFYIDLNGYWHIRIEWWKYLKDKAYSYSEYKTYTRALVELAWTYILMGGDKCKLAEECLNEVNSNLDRLSLETSINFYKNFAVYYMTQKDYNKAHQYIAKSSEVLNSQSSLTLEKKMVSRLQVSNYYYSAEINYKRGNKSDALKEFQCAANLADQIGWQRLSNYSYNYISLIYIEMDGLDEAKEILEKGLKDARHSREIRRIALYELAFALLYQKRENYSTAINYANSCLEVFRNSLMQEEVAIVDSIIKGSIEHLHSDRVGGSF
jgi:hypothetical protein